METIRRVVEEEGRAEAENSAREFEDQHFEENKDSQGNTNLEVEEVEWSYYVYVMVTGFPGLAAYLPGIAGWLA